MWWQKNAVSSFKEAEKIVEELHVFVADVPRYKNGLFLISDHNKITANTEKARLRYPPYKAGDLVHVKCDQDFSWRDAWVQQRIGDGRITEKGRTETFPRYEILYSQADKLVSVAENANPVIVAGYDMREKFWRDVILEMMGRDDKIPHFVTYQDEDELFERKISIYDAYEKVRKKVTKKKVTKKKRKRTETSSVAEKPKLPKKSGKKNQKKTVTRSMGKKKLLVMNMSTQNV